MFSFIILIKINYHILLKKYKYESFNYKSWYINMKLK